MTYVGVEVVLKCLSQLRFDVFKSLYVFARCEASGDPHAEVGVAALLLGAALQAPLAPGPPLAFDQSQKQGVREGESAADPTGEK